MFCLEGSAIKQSDKKSADACVTAIEPLHIIACQCLGNRVSQYRLDSLANWTARSFRICVFAFSTPWAILSYTWRCCAWRIFRPYRQKRFFSHGLGWLESLLWKQYNMISQNLETLPICQTSRSRKIYWPSWYYVFFVPCANPAGKAMLFSCGRKSFSLILLPFTQMLLILRIFCLYFFSECQEMSIRNTSKMLLWGSSSFILHQHLSLMRILQQLGGTGPQGAFSLRGLLHIGFVWVVCKEHHSTQ